MDYRVETIIPQTVAAYGYVATVSEVCLYLHGLWPKLNAGFKFLLYSNGD